MNEKQYESVVALESYDRYMRFISKVADWEQLWSVRSDEGWLVPVVPEGFEYFPLWPHPLYAQRISDKNIPGHSATEITLQELIEHWLPLFKKDSVRVAIFPNHEWTFWCIEADELSIVLKNEMTNYE